MSKYPEVQTVVSQHGRPDDGTDATGFFNAEFFVPLKPFDAWPAGENKEKLTQEMTDTLQQQFPGVDFNFSQYIQDNVEEAASGVKGENSVKVYGNDLETLEKTADAIAAVARQGAGHHGSRGVSLPGPADDSHRRGPRAGGALWSGSRRRQRGGPDGHRRAERGRFVRGHQRSAFSDDGAAGRSLPAKSRCDPAHSGRGAGGQRQRAHSSAARGCGRRAAGVRRGVHLSRAAAALRAHQIQRARPRSRGRRARGAARGGRQGSIAGRLPPRMGGRIRQSAGGHRAPEHRRASSRSRSSCCCCI